ncbi:MAG TPA: hypothetical protein VGP94_11980, partial [Tepidisphaeraceae bacterium]|nr:hypothetical protein [Tepidisphaeraceae bacterium]
MKTAKTSIGAMALAALMLASLVGLSLLVWKIGLGASPTAAPGLSKQWHEQVYSLDPDEVVRFVPPPYSPQRMQDFARGWAGAPPKNELGQLVYHVLPTRTMQWGMSSGRGNLGSALMWSTGLTSADLNLPAKLGQLPADGDWIARINSPVDGRMKALESILSAVTGKELIIEKKPLERDVIVARGTYAFQEDEDYAALATNRGIGKPRPGEVHLYTVPISPILGAGGGTGNMAEFLKRLEETAHRKFIDEVQEPRPASIQWSNNSSQYLAATSNAKLDNLLTNVQKQTSLQFSKEK